MSYRRYEMFERELASLINKYSLEGGSDTPDFMIARYLVQCLDNLDLIIDKRENWYGRKCGNGISITGDTPLEPDTTPTPISSIPFDFDGKRI